MFKTSLLICLAVCLTACSSLKPFGKDTVVTETYYYRDGFKLHGVLRCLEDSLAAKGFYPEANDIQNSSGINRLMIYKGSSNVGMLDVYNQEGGVSSMAMVDNKKTKTTLDSIQRQCVKASSYQNSFGSALINGLIEGLK